MANYTVIVTISERYEFEDVLNEDEARQIAEDCISDNLPDLSRDAIITYNAIRTDIPLFGDLSDAGMDGA
jgi:hypothetical protein